MLDLVSDRDVDAFLDDVRWRLPGDARWRSHVGEWQPTERQLSRSKFNRGLRTLAISLTVALLLVVAVCGVIAIADRPSPEHEPSAGELCAARHASRAHARGELTFDESRDPDVLARYAEQCEIEGG